MLVSLASRMNSLIRDCRKIVTFAWKPKSTSANAFEDLYREVKSNSTNGCTFITRRQVRWGWHQTSVKAWSSKPETAKRFAKSRINFAESNLSSRLSPAQKSHHPIYTIHKSQDHHDTYACVEIHSNRSETL